MFQKWNLQLYGGAAQRFKTFMGKETIMLKHAKSWMRLTNDLVFFFVYASDTDQSRQALMAMLNLVLDRQEDPITRVTVVNGIHKGFKPSDKGTIMDIRAKTRSGEQFDIEMQNKVEENFANRTLMYGCRMVNSSLSAGDDYDKMKKSIVISFVNGVQFEDIPKLHTRFIMAEEIHGRPLTDRLEIHFLELGKLEEKEPALMTPLERFCAYLKYTGDEEKEDYVSKILEGGEEAITMSEQVYEGFTDDEVQEILRWHEQMAQWDRNTALHRAEQRGLRQGLEQGLERGIAALVETCEELGMTGEETAAKLQQKFDLDGEKALEYYQKYCGK